MHLTGGRGLGRRSKPHTHLLQPARVLLPASGLCQRASSREIDPSVGKDKAQLIPASLSCTHCAVVRHRHITMIYRISCWSPATSWLRSQRSWHGPQSQRLRCSMATFPSPCYLPCSSSPKALLVFTHPPFGAAPRADKAALAARAKARAGGFTSTTIITPQGACQLLCSVVIKTFTLEIQGGFPSVSALLCVGRSLIHVSVLQPSHDRRVGWSEIRDVVTH